LFRFDPYQQVKMVAQQTKRKSFCHRLDMFRVQVQKVLVISFFDEDILAVYSAIKYMVVVIIKQRGGTGHVFLPIADNSVAMRFLAW
jgi:hypothetical protein